MGERGQAPAPHRPVLIKLLIVNPHRECRGISAVRVRPNAQHPPPALPMPRTELCNHKTQPGSWASPCTVQKHRKHQCGLATFCCLPSLCHLPSLSFQEPVSDPKCQRSDSQRQLFLVVHAEMSVGELRPLQPPSTACQVTQQQQALLGSLPLRTTLGAA